MQLRQGLRRVPRADPRLDVGDLDARVPHHFACRADPAADRRRPLRFQRVALFGLVRENLPEKLWETAYALACDVAAADGKLEEAELRLLEEIRYELNIDRLHAAAIERGARARHLS